jgi:dTDP-4-dehydrorhamnose reductase
MKLVVTGAGGMLGSDLVAVAGGLGHEVVAFDRAELDVTIRPRSSGGSATPALTW